MQSHPNARPIEVTEEIRHRSRVPIHYWDGARNYTLVEATGPRHVLSGHPDFATAREYYQCVRTDGMLVLLCRDAEAWFLVGWWD